MSAPDPRWEVVRTDAGWHTRFVSRNGRMTTDSEVLSSARNAVRNIEATVGSPVLRSPFRSPDALGEVQHGHGPTLRLIEVRDVDERTTRP